jgi:glycosyltransferase involved in cell wall biosynthesis
LDEEFSNTIKDKIKGSKGIKYKPVFVTKDKIQVYMNACDVVVFPYQESLTSGAVILAMSFGKACIAPKLGCLQDVLDNTGAFMYESKDKDGLVNALKFVCTNKEKLEGMGQYNRHKVLQWSWDFVASETKKVYLDCI